MEVPEIVFFKISGKKASTIMNKKYTKIIILEKVKLINLL